VSSRPVRKIRHYTCPRCAQRIRVPEKYVGMTGACKLCGGRITVRPDKAVVAPDKAEADAPRESPPFGAPQWPEPEPAPARKASAEPPRPARREQVAPGPPVPPAPPPQELTAPPLREPEPELLEPLEPWKLDEPLPEPAQQAPSAEPSAPTEPPVHDLTTLEGLLGALSDLPRTAPSVREVDEKLPRPLFLSDDDLARSKAYFDVPFLVARKGEALAVVKTTRDNVGPGTTLAVASGDISFAASSHPMPEYPILQLLFTVRDNAEHPLRFESLPLLTDGNVVEFLASVLQEHRLSFALYAGHQTHHVATGDVRLGDDAVSGLRDALAHVLAQWSQQRPKPAGHDLAVRRFARDAVRDTA